MRKKIELERVRKERDNMQQTSDDFKWIYKHIHNNKLQVQ